MPSAHIMVSKEDTSEGRHLLSNSERHATALHRPSAPALMSTWQTDSCNLPIVFGSEVTAYHAGEEQQVDDVQVAIVRRPVQARPAHSGPQEQLRAPLKRLARPEGSGSAVNSDTAFDGATRSTLVLLPDGGGFACDCEPPAVDAVPGVHVDALVQQRQHGAVLVGHRRPHQRRVPASGLHSGSRQEFSAQGAL